MTTEENTEFLSKNNPHLTNQEELKNSLLKDCYSPWIVKKVFNNYVVHDGFHRFKILKEHMNPETTLPCIVKNDKFETFYERYSGIIQTLNLITKDICPSKLKPKWISYNYKNDRTN